MSWSATYPEVYTMRHGNAVRTMVLRHGSMDWGIVKEVYEGKSYSRHLPKDANVVVDVGASTGVFTLLASMMYPNAVIYAYECEPVNFGLLVHNIIRNGLENRVKAYQYAITGMRGKRVLNIHRPLNGVGGHSVVWGWSEPVGAKLEVKSITLEDVFQTNRIESIDVLKLDIEGSEREVIQSPYMMRVNMVTMEAHGSKDQIDKLIER